MNEVSAPLKPLLTDLDVADRLSVSPHTVHYWERNGILESVRLTKRTIRFEPDRVEQFIKDRRRQKA